MCLCVVVLPNVPAFSVFAFGLGGRGGRGQAGGGGGARLLVHRANSGLQLAVGLRG